MPPPPPTPSPNPPPPAYAHLTDRATLYAAAARVLDNRGCRGCDGVTVGAFRRDLERQLDSLQDALLTGCYRPLPLLRFAVPKRSGGGKRWLSVPTVRDRVAQAAVYLVTRDAIEAELEDTSHAYREGRSVRTAVAQVRQLRDEGFRWAVDADVDAFFDEISHPRLFDKLCALGLDDRLLGLLARWVEAEVYDGTSLRRLANGIPQGAVVSPMLANLFLDKLDEALTGLGLRAVRYADDFLVLCRDRGAAEEALELTDLVLEEMGLDLNREKTRVASFDGGFKFLGAIFAGDTIYQLFDRPKREHPPPQLPPPLDLRRYLELRAATP